MSAEVSMVEEEKKSQDSASRDQDVETLFWSDDPVKSYFRQMLEEKQSYGTEVDSILGNNTIGQIYSGRERSDTEDSFMKSDPNAPLRLAILGPEDDLSTIAGDTISGSVVTEGAVFSNANLPYAYGSGKPLQRDFKEYNLKTPKKPKKRRWYPYMKRDDDDEDDKDNDEDTQPETPPGLIGVPEKGSNSKGDGESESKDNDASTLFTYVSPSKKVYLCAAVIGAVLVVAIGGLAIAYLEIKGGKSTGAGGAPSGNPLANFNSGNFPSGGSPVASPVQVPNPSAEINGTPAPVVVPTQAPVTILLDTQADLVDILNATGVDVMAILDEPKSPQYRALRWLAGDPNFFSYTEPRLIQRWTLAVIGLGLTTDQAKANTAASTLPRWLNYDTNECNWFSTGSATICNGFGYYQHLELQNQQLYGTIPSEIALLSDSLEYVDLRGNLLSGTLPTEIGYLTNMLRFQLTRNAIEGTIPTELSNMSNLEVLGLGRNNFTGPIPSELGSMSVLNTIGFEHNFLNGTIPSELGNLSDMLVLVLTDNKLSGTIPTELGSLSNLQTLDIGFNLFSGQVPSQICSLTGLSSLEADCQSISCSCCTTCTATPNPTPPPTPVLSPGPPTTSPTFKPTVAITSAPSPFPTSAKTPFPTAAPSPTPTGSPTVCSPFIKWVPQCIATGQDLVVSYQNCNPQFGDWIGIFDNKAIPTNLPSPYLWAWSCGTQSCRGSPKSNTVTLGASNVQANTTSWPLQKGNYFAFMVRNSGSPYSAFLESTQMKIQNKGC